MKYTYKDFVTKKIRFTCGEFCGWTPGTGIIGVPYAIFRTKSQEILVPKYLVTPKTMAAIPQKEGKMKIKSVKYSEKWDGSLSRAVARAREILEEYQPAFGVQIEDDDGEVVWDSEEVGDRTP